jgi:hypothetical protein
MIDDEFFPHIPDRSIFADHEHLGARMVVPAQAMSSSTIHVGHQLTTGAAYWFDE